MTKRIKVLICALAASLLAIVLSLSLLSGIPLFSFDNTLAFDVIDDMAQSDNYIALLDTSNSRIILMNRKNIVKRVYKGNGRNFDSAEAVTVDNDGNVYIINANYEGGTLVSRELIKFDRHFRRSVLSGIDCRETDHRFYSLTYSPAGNTVSYFIVSPFDAYTLVENYSVDVNSDTGVSLQSCHMPADFGDSIIDIDSVDANRFMYSKRNGEICASTFDTGTEFILLANHDGSGLVPAALANDEYSQSGIYFFDTKSKDIKQVIRNIIYSAAPQTVVTEYTELNNLWTYAYFDFDVYKGSIITACENVLLTFEQNQNTLKIDKAKLSFFYLLLRYIFWLCLLVFAAASILTLVYLFRDKKVYTRLGRYGKQECVLVMGLAVCTILCGVTAARIYIGYFNDMQTDTLLNASNIISDSYCTEDFDKLQTVRDYKSPAYNKLYDDTVRALNNYTGSWIEDFYIGFAAVRDDDMTMLFNSGGKFSASAAPSWKPDERCSDIYKEAADTGFAVMRETRSPNEKCRYAVAPIKRSDNSVCAYMELGISASALTDSIVSIFYSEMYMLIGFVTVLILFSAKLIFFFNIILRRDEKCEYYKKYKFPYERPIIRLISFCVFLLTGIPIFALPSMIIELSDSPMYVGIAISLLIFGAVEAFLIFSEFADKIKIRSLFGFGILCIGAGALLYGFMREIAAIASACFIMGFGAGICVIGIREFASVIKPKYSHNFSADIPKYNADMFIGIACGIILGILIFNAFGAKIMSIVTAVAALCVMWLCEYIMPNIKTSANREYKRITIKTVLTNKKLLMFIITAVVPRVMSVLLVFFFIPLMLTQRDNCPITLMGLLILLFSLIMVYIAPTARKHFKNMINSQQSIILSLMLMFIAVAVFAAWCNVYTAAAAAVILGFAYGMSEVDAVIYINGAMFENRAYINTAAYIYRSIWLWCAAAVPVIYSVMLMYDTRKGLLLLTLFIGLCMVYFRFCSRVLSDKDM